MACWDACGDSAISPILWQGYSISFRPISHAFPRRLMTSEISKILFISFTPWAETISSAYRLRPSTVFSRIRLEQRRSMFPSCLTHCTLVSNSHVQSFVSSSPIQAQCVNQTPDLLYLIFFSLPCDLLCIRNQPPYCRPCRFPVLTDTFLIHAIPPIFGVIQPPYPVPLLPPTIESTLCGDSIVINKKAMHSISESA